MKACKSPRHPRCNLTCHLRKMRDPKCIQEREKLPCKIECLDDIMKLPECPSETFPLLISDKQGLIEIHISRLQLSTAVSIIAKIIRLLMKLFM